MYNMSMEPEYHTFSACIIRVLAREGGFTLSNVTGDRGGLTYAGISRVKHPKWAGWRAIDSNDFPTARASVFDFYRVNFWVPAQCDLLRDNEISPGAVLDMAINHGATGAIKIFQAALEVKTDGQLGPITLAAAKSCTPKELMARITNARNQHYADICNNDRSQSKFLLGWLNRALEVGKAELWGT